MLYKFRAHPSPGVYENGRVVTNEPSSIASLKTGQQQKAIASGGGLGGGGSGGGGAGSGGTGGGFGSVPNNMQMASGVGNSSSSYGGGNTSANVDRYNPVRDRLEEGSVVEDWIPRDAAGLDDMFMLMYHRCPIAGTIVDLIADTIWSPYDLVGVNDPAIRRIYEQSMEAIDVIATMPDITREYLVLGRSISSLIFNKEQGVFKDLVSHDPSFVRLTPIPIKGYDPKIDLIPSPALRSFMQSEDPRDLDARKLLPAAYIDAVRKAGGSGAMGMWGTSGINPGGGLHGMGSQTAGGIPLDPVNTLFIARKVFNYDMIGTSLYTRLISFWALEKALINASVTSARRRSRAILHIRAGIDNMWEASAAELDNLAGMFIQADEDPVGAVVVTRTGVDATEIRQGQDFYKWSDEWEMLTQGKLRALGANDALLSGDATYSNQENARMFFMEKALSLRNVLTKRIYTNRVFPLLARIHGFVKRSQAELDHKVRTTPSKPTLEESMKMPNQDLIMPTIQWRKELINNIDEKRMEILDKMEEKGVPVTLRSWATAANFDLDAQIGDLELDAELRRRVAMWKSKYEEGFAEREVKDEMVESMRKLAQSNLKKVMANVQSLGPLGNYIFWDNKGEFAGVKAKDLAAFLDTIDPNSNSIRVLAESAALQLSLARHFQDVTKAQTAHFLLFRSGLTSSAPALPVLVLKRISDAIKATASQCASQEDGYKVFQMAEQELKQLQQLDQKFKAKALNKLDQVTSRVYNSPDKISVNSADLYSGRAKD